MAGGRDSIRTWFTCEAAGYSTRVAPWQCVECHARYVPPRPPYPEPTIVVKNTAGDYLPFPCQLRAATN
jgi:hypothetical protein